MFNNLREDLRRCGETPGGRFRELLLNTGMWAVVGYRFRRWVFVTPMPRPVRWILNIPATLIQLWIEMTTTIQLPSSADIGPGLYIAHTGYIVINSRAVIGNHCTLTQGVTIGHGGGGEHSQQSCPMIGDRVYLGPGSALIGAITIGDDALIGVGAIVTRSVPPRGVVVGNPARVLSTRGSFDLITYPGMEQDSERSLSLAQREQSRNPRESEDLTNAASTARF